MLEFKDGDIFQWNYNDALRAGKETQALYWCCSRFFVVRNGRLEDTYYSGFSYDHTRRFTFKEANEKLELEYLGNFNDLEKIETYRQTYYDDKDIVNLNHPNSTYGNLYLRKGATKSKEKMLRVLNSSIADSKFEIEIHTNSIERNNEKIKKILSGEDLNEIYI